MKKVIAILTICLAMATAARAQVFMTTEDYENPRDGIENDWGQIPQQWLTDDQANEFAPLGEGLLLLASLGGAYLLKKKENK